MVFISLAAFVRRYYCKMVFWAHFVPQNRCFMALAAHKFDKTDNKWYQSMHIDSRDTFIYGFYWVYMLAAKLLEIYFSPILGGVAGSAIFGGSIHIFPYEM